MARRRADPALDGDARSCVGSRAGRRLDRPRVTVGPGQSRAGPQIAAGQDAAPRRHHVGPGAAAERDAPARSRRQPDDVPELPYLMGDELLRLPSADEGQRAKAHAPQRGRPPAQLDRLQLPDASRRRLHARDRRHRRGRADLAGALVLRGPRGLPERQPRVGVFATADGVGGRAGRSCLQHVRPAHGPVHRDQDVHGLSSVPTRRQQRLDGSAADAGDELLQLRRPLRMGGRGRRRPRGRRRHRARGAPGRHRQLAAPSRVPVAPRRTHHRRWRPARGPSPSRARRALALRPRRGAVDPAPRRVSLHGQRPRRIPRVRRGPDRPEGILGASRDRSGLALGPALVREDEVRDGGRLADHAGRRPDPHPAARKPGAEDPSALRLSLRHRPRRGPGRHRQPRRQPKRSGRGHAARRSIPGGGSTAR